MVKKSQRTGLDLSPYLSFTYTGTKQPQNKSKPSVISVLPGSPWLSPATSAFRPSCQRGCWTLRFAGDGSLWCLLVEQPPCTLHAASKIGSCYYEARDEVKQMALKRCSKKLHFHQHVQCFFCKGHFYYSAAVCKAVTDLGHGLNSRWNFTCWNAPGLCVAQINRAPKAREDWGVPASVWCSGMNYPGRQQHTLAGIKPCLLCSREHVTSNLVWRGHF